MCTMRGVRISPRLARIFWERMVQEAQALAHGDAALEQEGPNLVYAGGPLADQACANPMQRLQVELVNTLSRHEAHGGTLHRLGHGFGIAEVVLRPHARTEDLSWNQDGGDRTGSQLRVLQRRAIATACHRNMSLLGVTQTSAQERSRDNRVQKV
jgi:hypothetical protein